MAGSSPPLEPHARYGGRGVPEEQANSLGRTEGVRDQNAQEHRLDKNEVPDQLRMPQGAHRGHLPAERSAHQVHRPAHCDLDQTGEVQGVVVHRAVRMLVHPRGEAMDLWGDRLRKKRVWTPSLVSPGGRAAAAVAPARRTGRYRPGGRRARGHDGKIAIACAGSSVRPPRTGRPRLENSDDLAAKARLEIMLELRSGRTPAAPCNDRTVDHEEVPPVGVQELKDKMVRMIHTEQLKM